MSCECGCGLVDGEDAVAQYLVEEACVLALELHEARVASDLAEARERASAAAAAVAQVKRELAEIVG